MCGIFGIISSKNEITESKLVHATNLLSHRGPDFQNTYLSENRKVGLGHTRLSILDLSDRANQPIHSPCGRYIMVYNGEVYNFKGLAKELVNENKDQPKSSGDTEIILRAFVKWGPSFVNKLNGMFSIAIWDNKENTLHLYRDRMGIKPLYIYEGDGLLIFGSELKSIVSYPDVKHNLKIDQRSFYAFMHLGYIPEPLSVYQNISKFPSGSYGVYTSDSNLKLNAYWNLDDQVSEQIISNEKEAEHQLENLIYKSVEKRLVSDVPLGTFLSGGIDSSTITSIASKLSPNRLNTFSIGFNDSKFDESQYSKKIASYLKTNHTEFILSEKEAIPYLEEMTGTFDEPFADTSAIPTMLISKLASEHVKVILTGDGGDEQFLGYGSYNWADRLDYPILKNNLTKKGISKLLSMGNNRSKRIARLFDQVGNGGLRSHIFSQEQYFFGNSELRQVINSYQDDFVFDYSEKELSNRSAAEMQSFFDLKYYLKDDLLVKVDRSSMKYGLECRVPLLDHELVEFSMNLNRKLKIKDGQSKHLLKKVLFTHIPENYFNRPKWGFGIPLDKWLRNEMRYLIDDYLDEKTTRGLGYFNYDHVKSILSRFYKGETYLYHRLWLIILWHKWAKANNMAAA